MLLEFIVVHSAGFMGTVALAPDRRTARARTLVLFGLFYSVFVAGFALAFRTWWPLAAFWGLTANRLLGVVVGQAPEGRERQFIQAGWAAGALFYVLSVMVTVILPVPRLGITRAVRDAVDLPGSGAWVDEPWRAVAGAACYFLLVGFSELKGHRFFLRAADNAARSRS